MTMPLCYLAVSLAGLALGLAGYPYAHAYWEGHSRRARWQRRLLLARTL